MLLESSVNIFALWRGKRSRLLPLQMAGREASAVVSLRFKPPSPKWYRKTRCCRTGFFACFKSTVNILPVASISSDLENYKTREISRLYPVRDDPGLPLQSRPVIPSARTTDGMEAGMGSPRQAPTPSESKIRAKSQ